MKIVINILWFNYELSKLKKFIKGNTYYFSRFFKFEREQGNTYAYKDEEPIVSFSFHCS